MSAANWEVFKGHRCTVKCGSTTSDATCVGAIPGIDITENGSLCFGVGDDGLADVQAAKDWADRLQGIVTGFEIDANGRTYFNVNINKLGAKQCSDFFKNTQAAMLVTGSSTSACQARAATVFADNGLSFSAAEVVAYDSASGACVTMIEQLEPSADYTFYFAGDVNSNLAPIVDAPAAPRTDLLQFKDISLSTGGTFKACYCDSSLLSTSVSFCSKPSDFTIEVCIIEFQLNVFEMHPNLRQIIVTN